MPNGFPKYETKGSKKLFTFRIPKFNNTVLMDPTMNMDGVAGDPVSEGGDGGDGGGDGGDGGGDGGKDPDGGNNSASMLPFNIFALAVLLHVASMFTIL